LSKKMSRSSKKRFNCILKIPSKGLFPPELELYEKCLVNWGNAIHLHSLKLEITA
jgi:hypothetical protein